MREKIEDILKRCSKSSILVDDLYQKVYVYDDYNLYELELDFVDQEIKLIRLIDNK